MKTILSFTSVLTAAISLELAAAAAEPELTRYHVKVTDAVGQPVAGALVELYRGPDTLTSAEWHQRLAGRNTTDTNGAALFAVTNQAVAIFVAGKPGLSLAWSLCWLGMPQLDPGDQPVVLALTPPTTVSGVVQDAAGKPLADAQVWVNLAFRPTTSRIGAGGWPFLNADAGRRYLAARTSVDGKFCIEKLPADAALELGASKPGLALDQPEPARSGLNLSSLNLRAGQSDIVLTLKPAGSIEGVVVQATTGAPLAGARVTSGDSIFGAGAQPLPPTGPDGRFRLADLSPGQHRLRAVVGTNSCPDWVCEPVTVELEVGATNRDVKITASRGGVVEITVHRKDGDLPVAKASIVLAQQTNGESATTSDQGLARLRVVPGSYHLMVSKSGLVNHQVQLTVEDDQTNQVAVTLDPAPKITGTVLDPDGKPAPGIAVSYIPFNGQERKSDAQGRFTLLSDPNRFGGQQQPERFVVARDPARNLAAALALDEDATNAALRLEAGLTLGGRVADPKGKPITNAVARLRFLAKRGGSSLGEPVPTDAQGRFEFTGLPRSHHYQVNVAAPGFGQDNHDLPAADAATNRVDLETFQLPLANLLLAGVVVDADDNPVAGASINTYGKNQPQLSGRTDSEGHFSFNRVCPGPITLSANDRSANNPRGDQYGNIAAEGGDTNITLHLGNVVSHNTDLRRKINGIVLDPDGKPAARVVVSIFPNSEEKTDEAGRFVVTFDPNKFGDRVGLRRVILARDPHRNLAAALDVDKDATNATLRLAPGLTLVGHATDSDGKPLTNAQAEVTFQTFGLPSRLVQSVRANAGGQFEIKALPADRRFTVIVTAEGYGQDWHTAETGEGENRRIELDPFQLLVTDQRIAGVVVDADDKPVAGASIIGRGKNQPHLSGRTDWEGHFSFDHVCPGPITLSANDRSANNPRGGEAGWVSAEGGDTNITIHLGSIVESRATAQRPVSLRGKPLPGCAAAGLTTDDAPASRVSLRGKPLPGLAAAGLTTRDAPANQPVLALLIDAEQRPCRLILRLLGEQAPALKQKGVAVVVLQSSDLAEEAFTAWKQQAASPFPVARLKQEPEKARAAWGASALPWFILTDKSHRVIAEGFALDDLDAKLGELK